MPADASTSITDESIAMFTDFAREALAASEGASARAVELMADRILADRPLFEQHQRAFAIAFAREYVGKALSKRRPSPDSTSLPPQDGERVASMFQNAIAASFQRFLDAPIFGGKRIGDATVAEVRESADAYGKQARTMKRQADWQTLVADAAEKNGASGSDSIRSCLAETTLAKLWETVDVQ